MVTPFQSRLRTLGEPSVRSRPRSRFEPRFAAEPNVPLDQHLSVTPPEPNRSVDPNDGVDHATRVETDAGTGDVPGASRSTRTHEQDTRDGVASSGEAVGRDPGPRRPPTRPAARTQETTQRVDEGPSPRRTPRLNEPASPRKVEEANDGSPGEVTRHVTAPASEPRVDNGSTSKRPVPDKPFADPVAGDGETRVPADTKAEASRGLARERPVPGMSPPLRADADRLVEGVTPPVSRRSPQREPGARSSGLPTSSGTMEYDATAPSPRDQSAAPVRRTAEETVAAIREGMSQPPTRPLTVALNSLEEVTADGDGPRASLTAPATRPPAVLSREAAEAAPTTDQAPQIHVHIDRIDVVSPPAATPNRAPRRSPAEQSTTSLADYLDSRSQGRLG